MCQSDLCLYKLFLISNGRLLPFLLSAPLCKKNCSIKEIRKRIDLNVCKVKNDSNGLGPNKKKKSNVDYPTYDEEGYCCNLVMNYLYRLHYFIVSNLCWCCFLF